MNFLEQLFKVNEAANTNNRLDVLPDKVISEIKKNITKGAKDTQQDWSNALALVQRAYKVAGVQRPTPNMKGAWKQYEEMMAFAVQQLAKARGLTADWRMSSAVFRESMERKYKYHVEITNVDGGSSQFLTVEGKNLEEIITTIRETVGKEFKVDVLKNKVNKPNKETVLSFSNWGIKNNMKVIIKPPFHEATP